MNHTGGTSYDKDPHTLEREIDQTRADMDRTLGALERKLSPRNLVDQVFDYVGRRGPEVADSIGGFVRRNPLPVALAGLGAAWILLRPKSTSVDADYEYIGADPEFGDDTVGYQSGETESDGEHSITRRLGEKARWPVKKSREQADRLKESVTTMAGEQPLLLGAMGLLLGAAIGAVLPESRAESRWLGPARDETMDRIKQQGKQAFQQVRDAAQRGVDEVKKAVSDVATGK
jgi:hypothetical protein